MKWNCIACVEDLVRPAELLGAFPVPLLTLVGEPIRQGVRQAPLFEPGAGLPTRLVEYGGQRFDWAEFTRLAYDEEHSSWEQLNFSLPEPAGAYLRTCIAPGTLLLAVEMPAWFKAWCNEYAIDYLDLRISPLRFARDFYVAIDTNCAALYERIEPQGVLPEEVALEATAMSASALKQRWELDRRGTYAQDLGDTLIFIGQTSFDAAIIGSSGRHLRCEDFTERLRAIVRSRPGYRVLYKPHPYDDGFAAQELQSLASIIDRPIAPCPNNSYQVLCSTSNVELIAISSGVLQEAEFFGKTVHWLHEPLVPLAWPGERARSGHYLQVHFQELLAPSFWHRILDPEQAAPRIPRLPALAPDHGRELLDTWWDYSKFKLWQRNFWIEAFERSGGGLLRQRVAALEAADTSIGQAPQAPVEAADERWSRCLHEIQARIKAQPQQFGRGELYQAHEAWGVPGQRPTLQRIEAYQLQAWLPAHARVLDIGCNIGMFGLALSTRIHSYYGFDNNPLLIDVARQIASVREIGNCHFECESFEDFSLHNQGRTFDMVLSFAVHVWIGMTPGDYARTLYGLLRPGGLLVLESNRLDTNDKDFFRNVRYFLDEGFDVRFCGRLKDDGIIERGFYVLAKEGPC
ncbi:class I SAM-dependent methyltransferase [Phytopseudomonas dryadis]|uniref:Methyltransferase domain-containing protein n=1 Tax=Phytopseudomonas dryadis TaxID=2487520 RepID=A0ABY1ZD13_9GAMM|nr:MULTISPECIES: class I SAM-dependent methyltransferase [Pseudomonas]TBV07937.1 hypothetical protein DNK34_07125 [Pseudomonas dryadis]TBV19332.1 hypothetical protein DNK41_04310 [Pseudomonas sp. FRB 230]